MRTNCNKNNLLVTDNGQILGTVFKLKWSQDVFKVITILDINSWSLVCNVIMDFLRLCIMKVERQKAPEGL